MRDEAPEQRLCRLIARGCYERALPALEEYIRLAAATKDPHALRKACGLLASARLAVLAGRADLTARFARQRPAPRAYAPFAAAPTWSLDA